MSLRGVLLDSPYNAGPTLGNSTSWNDITANKLALVTLVVQDLYATTIHSGGEDQVPDIYFYGSVDMSTTYAGNAGSLISTVDFPQALYDGLPGDPLAPSIQLSLVKTTVIKSSVPPNTVNNPGYFAPMAFMFRNPNVVGPPAIDYAGEVNGIFITVPCGNAATQFITPAYGQGVGQTVSWYCIGAPPNHPPSFWTTIQLPVGAYDAVTNPNGWNSHIVASTTGYSSCIMPIQDSTGNAGIVGINPASVLIGPVSVATINTGYANAAAEAVDFPYTIQPLAPLTGGELSPQTPIVTQEVPISPFWCQAVVAYVPPNPSSDINYRAAGLVNITQAIMLGSQGNNGLTSPCITAGTTVGYGLRFRIFGTAPLVDTRTQNGGPLSIQFLLGHGLTNPVLATPIAGIPRLSLSSWYAPNFFTVAPTPVAGNQPTFLPELTVFLGCASGVAGGGIGTSPLTVQSTRWSTNEFGGESKLFKVALSVNTTATLFYTGNPNFNPTAAVSGESNAHYVNGWSNYELLPNAGAPPTPDSLVAGWSNSRQYFEII